MASARDTGEMVDGKKHGYWVTYYANGNKRSEGNYIEGKKEGPWIQYHKNGNKASEACFRDGKNEGDYVCVITRTATASGVVRIGNMMEAPQTVEKKESGSATKKTAKRCGASSPTRKAVLVRNRMNFRSACDVCGEGKRSCLWRR